MITRVKKHVFDEYGLGGNDGTFIPKNLTHILLSNQAQDSTGGQPMLLDTMKLEEVTYAAGYKMVKKVTSEDVLGKSIRKSFLQRPIFILVKIEKGDIEGIIKVSHPREMIKN